MENLFDKVFYKDNKIKLGLVDRNNYPFRIKKNPKALEEDKPWTLNKMYLYLSIKTNLPVKVIRRLYNTYVELVYSELRKGNSFRMGFLGRFEVRIKKGKKVYDFQNRVMRKSPDKEVIEFIFTEPIRIEFNGAKLQKRYKYMRERDRLSLKEIRRLKAEMRNGK